MLSSKKLRSHLIQEAAANENIEIIIDTRIKKEERNNFNRSCYHRLRFINSSINQKIEEI